MSASSSSSARPDFSQFLGHAERVIRDYPQGIRDLATVGRDGISVVLMDTPEVGRDDIPEISCIELECIVTPSRRRRWRHGGPWREARLSKGHVLIGPPGVKGNNHHLGPHQSLEIGLPVSFLLDAFSEVGAGEDFDFSALDREPVRDPLLADCIHELSRVAFDRRTPAATAYIDHLGSLLAHRVLVAIPTQGSRPNRVRALTWAEVRRVRDFAIENLSAELTTRDLGAVLGLSAFHFSRAFRLATGQPPYRWLLNLRLELAISRLRQAADSEVDRIARETGLGDRKRLNRTLRTHCGDSLRNLWRKNCSEGG